MSSSRYLNTATPMLTGSASRPPMLAALCARSATPDLPDSATLKIRQATVATAPVSSHFNCWRRSPVERL